MSLIVQSINLRITNLVQRYGQLTNHPQFFFVCFFFTKKENNYCCVHTLSIDHWFYNIKKFLLFHASLLIFCAMAHQLQLIDKEIKIISISR